MRILVRLLGKLLSLIEFRFYFSEGFVLFLGLLVVENFYLLYLLGNVLVVKSYFV